MQDGHPALLVKVRMTDTLSHAENDYSARMATLVHQLACMLVDSPDRVRVESENGGSETVLRLYVAPSDIGQVIGKQGRTARSLRTLLLAASSKSGHRFSLDVVEG